MDVLNSVSKFGRSSKTFNDNYLSSHLKTKFHTQVIFLGKINSIWYISYFLRFKNFLVTKKLGALVHVCVCVCACVCVCVHKSEQSACTCVTEIERREGESVFVCVRHTHTHTHTHTLSICKMFSFFCERIFIFGFLKHFVITSQYK